MTARIVPIRADTEDRRRWLLVDRHLREGAGWIAKALEGRCSLAEGTCEAQRHVNAAVAEVMRAEVAG